MAKLRLAPGVPAMGGHFTNWEKRSKFQLLVVHVLRGLAKVRLERGDTMAEQSAWPQAALAVRT